LPVRTPYPHNPGLLHPGVTNPDQVPRFRTLSQAADPVRPTTAAEFYIRKTGSDTNGGSSSSTTPDAQGTDGVTNGTTTFTAATGTFASGDVNKLIMIGTKARYRIVAVGGTTSITLSGSPSAGSGLTWKMGGSVLTIGALLTIANSPASTILGGDRIWIGAGVYREVITVGPTPTFELQINGDVDGLRTGDNGMVQLTAYTTDDKTAPSATTLVNMNGKSNLTFQNIFFVGGNNPAVVTATTITSQNIGWYNCAFIQTVGVGSRRHMSVTSGYGVPLNWRINRCLFVGSTLGALVVTCTTGVGTDYDVNVLITNSMFNSFSNSQALAVTNSGTLANKGNGVRARNCTFFGPVITTTAAQVSTSFPSSIISCYVWQAGNGTAFSAGTLGHVIEDYNIIVSQNARANVTAGSHSVSDESYSPLFHFGQEFQWGGTLRPFGEPMSASPLLGFGNDGNQTSYDLFGRPRPAGEYATTSGAAAVGALSRANTWVKETGTVQTGTNAISCTGPGIQDFLIPVDTTATTVSAYLRYDTSYVGTPPHIEILQNSEIGVPAVTVQHDGPHSTWQQLTLPSFTATAAGIVTLRVTSTDTSGAGKTFFDTVSIT
jgi:hypothetical protein